MSMNLIPSAKIQFLDDNGNPLAHGTVEFCIKGTLTPKDTWQNYEQTALNTNPIELDGGGRANIWGNGFYRQIVKDVDGNLIYDRNLLVPGGIGGVDSVANVRDFGAVGDGVTNDLAAIQSAVTALEAAGGGGLYFPAGRYLIAPIAPYTGPGINLSGLTHIVAFGDGVDSIIERSNSFDYVGHSVTAFHIFNIIGASSKITIRDLLLDGSGAAIVASGATATMYGVFVSAVTAFGEAAGAIADVDVRNCFFFDQCGDGVYAVGDSPNSFLYERLRITGNTFSLGQACGVRPSVYGKSITIAGNFFSNQVDQAIGKPSGLGAVERLSIEDNTFVYDLTVNQIFVDVGSTSSTYQTTNVRFVGNTIVGASVSFNYLTNAVIGDNVFFGPTGANAVILRGCKRRVVMAANVIVDNNTTGAASAAIQGFGVTPFDSDNTINDLEISGGIVYLLGTQNDGIRLFDPTGSVRIGGVKISAPALLAKNGIFVGTANAATGALPKGVEIDDCVIRNLASGINIECVSSDTEYIRGVRFSDNHFQACTTNVVLTCAAGAANEPFGDLMIANNTSEGETTWVNNATGGRQRFWMIGGNGKTVGQYQVVGSPENVITAKIGSLASRSDGGAGTSLYVKESTTGNTGWIGK